MIINLKNSQNGNKKLFKKNNMEYEKELWIVFRNTIIMYPII